MEHLVISGYVTFSSHKFEAVKRITNCFDKLGIQKGYLAATYRILNDDKMELSIYSDCEIGESIQYRELISKLKELIDFSSSIEIVTNDVDVWASVTTLSPKGSTIITHNVYAAEGLVTKLSS